MTTRKFLLGFTLGLLITTTLHAQTTFNAVSGNWSTPGNWSAGVPDAADAVTIPANRAVTVDVDAVCASITYTAGTTSSSISLNDGVTLSVTGTITMNAPAAANTIQSLDVANGIVNCAGLVMANNADSTRRNRLDITNGTINISTTFTLNGSALGENQIRFFGTGLLNYGGSTFGLSTNDTYIRGNGSIELSRDGTCTLPTSIVYNRIIISGTGNKTISSTTMNKLFIRAGGTALSNNTLVVNDSTMIDGTYSITSSTGSRTFHGHVLLNSGGLWSNTANESIALNGGFTNAGTFTPGTGTYTFGVNEQDLNGPNPFIFLGAVTVSSPAIVNNYDSVSIPGTFTLSSGATWVNQANSQVRFGSTTTLTGSLECSAIPNTVHFDRNNTQVSQNGETYYNLIKSNSSTLTLGTGTTTVQGNLIITSPCSLVCAANTLAVEGNIGGNGTITQSAGGNISLEGDNLHTGTFTPSTSTFTYNGSNQIVRGTTYNNLVINGSGIKSMNADLTVSGTATFTNGNLFINGNRLTLNGVVSTTSGLIQGSLTSNLTIGGSAANAALGFTQTDSTTRSLSNFTLTRANGATLNNALEIIDSVSVSNGTLTSNGNLTLVSTASATARVGRISSGGIAGNVIAQRFIPGGTNKRKWRYLSSPVNISGSIKISQLIDDVHVTGTGGVPNGFDDCSTCAPSLRTYTESVAGDADQGWTNPADTSVSISTGIGFELFVRGNRNTPQPYINWAVPNDATIDYIGTINSGAVNLNIDFTNNGVTTADGFNLVGNPYPSQIDWMSSGWTKTNLEGYFWTYNPDPSIDAYGIFSTALGTGTNDITRYIASGQGFFVKATGASAVLGFTENIKRTNSPYNFYKSANSTSSEASFFRLKATNDQSRDELIIALDSNSTLAVYDDADANKFFGNRLNFYSKSSEAISLAINQTNFPSSVKEDTINLSFFSYDSTAIKVGLHHIELSEKNNLPKGLKIELVDYYTNTKLNLTEDSSYTFSVEQNAGSFGNNRFDLILSNTSVGITNRKTESINIYPNPVTGNTLYIKNVSSNMTQYALYDVLGNKIQSGNTSPSAIDVSNLQPGIYIIITVQGTARFIKQ